jgi:hypothetical protein
VFDDNDISFSSDALSRPDNPHAADPLGAKPLRLSVGPLRSRRRSWRCRFVLGLTALTFTLLVSVAASHLHIAPDADETCAVCAAFAGKIEGPSVSVPTLALASLVYTVCSHPVSRPVPPAPAHLLPPTCGPPQLA